MKPLKSDAEILEQARAPFVRAIADQVDRDMIIQTPKIREAIAAKRAREERRTADLRRLISVEAYTENIIAGADQTGEGAWCLRY